MRTGGQVDGQTDRLKLLVAFRNFVNAPKNTTASLMSSKGIRNRSWKSRLPNFIPKHTNRQYYKEEGKVICVRHDTRFGDFYMNFSPPSFILPKNTKFRE